MSADGLGRRADVAVVGGGLAGLAAAIAAAKRGLGVVLVRRGLGATAMCSGGLDFPDELPHLYGATLAGAVRSAPGGAALWLRDVLAPLGAELVGRPGEVLPLMDTAGVVRRTNLALAQHAAGRVDRWSGERLLFLGVDGYASFRPEWVRRVAVTAGLVGPERVAAAILPVPGLEGQANLAASRIARALEAPGAATRFGGMVAAAARRARAAWVALPPVLGLDRAAEVHGEVAQAVREAFPGIPATVFELLSPPPSLPGQRLQRLLERAATEAGVDLVWGRVLGPAPPGPAGSGGAGEARPVLAAVAVESRGRPWRLEARQFVLATGKFAAGGLGTVDETIVETTLGLDVFAPAPPGWPPGPEPVGRRRVSEMVWERFAARHPVFEAGLVVDEELRPLDASGRVVYANLRAAGSLLGGPNFFADGVGAGVAVTTGLLAGCWAAEAASGERRELA